MKDLEFKVRMKGSKGEVEVSYDRANATIVSGVDPAQKILDMAIQAYNALKPQP